MEFKKKMLILENFREITLLRVRRRTSRVTILAMIFLLSFAALTSHAQKERKLIKDGNVLYDKGKFKEAEMNYRKALDANKNSTRGLFNLGDAVYQQRNFEESSKIFGSLAGSNLSSAEKANVLHNLGNSLLEAKDYEKSILAYQNALLNNPADRDTKYNLEYARMMMKKQQEQQKQQQQQKKDQQDKDKKDQKKNEQNKDQKPDKKDQQDQSKKISKEDADRMLEAMKKDEKKTLQKLKKEKAKVQQVVIEKDW
jgi:Ca-activated chloride channel homolog